jgi:hypothetical protein
MPAMFKRMLGALLLLVLGAIAGIWLWQRYQREVGLILYVLLEQRDGLAPGDPVLLKDFEIGEVREVELKDGRVRVRIRVQREFQDDLRINSTFKVESLGRDRRCLQAYVVDPQSPPIRGGETIEGVGSGLELALRIGQERARAWMQNLSRSEWARKTGRRLDQLQRELDEIDWKGAGERARRKGGELSREITDLLSDTEAGARRGMKSLERGVDGLSRELEQLGKSEEARKLRRWLEQLAGDE